MKTSMYKFIFIIICASSCVYAQVGTELFCATHSTGTPCTTDECPGFNAYCQQYPSPVGNRCICGIFSSTPDTSVSVCTSDDNMCVWGTYSNGDCTPNGPTVICWPSTNQCKRSECKQSSGRGCQLVSLSDFNACSLDTCRDAVCYQAACTCVADLPTQLPTPSSSHTPTHTPTALSTPSIPTTQTPSASSTRSPTQTPSTSSTHSPTQTPSASLTQTPSASFNPTYTKTLMQNASANPSYTLTIIPSRIFNDTHNATTHSQKQHVFQAIIIAAIFVLVVMACLIVCCMAAFGILIVFKYNQKKRMMSPSTHKTLIDLDDDDTDTDTSTDNNEF